VESIILANGQAKINRKIVFYGFGAEDYIGTGTYSLPTLPEV
jgi:hypothetical protein